MGEATKFKTFANKSALIAVYGGVGILAVCIIVPLLFTPLDDMEWKWGYLLPGLIIVFFIVVILSAFLKLFITFSVSKDGILIYKPLFHRRFIPASSINEILYMDEASTYDFFSKEVKEHNVYKSGANSTGLLHKIKTESAWYKYLSISPSGTSSGTGQAERIQSVKIEAEMLLLLLKDGTKYCIAPKDAQGFYEMVKSIL